MLTETRGRLRRNHAALGNGMIPVKRGFPRIERWLLQQIFKAIGPAPIQLAIADGEHFSPPGVTPAATVRICDRRTLAKLLIDPEVAFGEGYARGCIQVEGDLVRLLETVYESIAGAHPRPGWYERLKSGAMTWRQANTLRGSRGNIHHHYDLGNDFYKLWLDRQLVYTCAYFPQPSASLEQAQEAKLDYVCRKLRLQPGETVVEAGCGWGSLALHMAERYGVKVRAFNISHEQILHARRAAAERGLSGRVEFIEDDYRNISGSFDVFVSVGMLEHIGRSHYAELGNIIHRSIGDTGRGLVHFIGRDFPGDLSRWIRKRIFPGAYAPALTEALRIFEPHGYSITDVENLRAHYAKTIEHWLERFERAGQQVSEMYDAWFQRAWRLYLAGSIAAFRTGSLQLFQVCFTGSKSQPAPWTRDWLYESGAAPGGQSVKWTHAMS